MAIDIESGRRRCERCGGSGQHYHERKNDWGDCEVCNGSGFVRATPASACSEAEWGEPKPDCPRCQGAGTYRSLAWGGLRPCPCGLSEPARSEAAGGEAVAESMEAYRIDRLLADWREGIAEIEAIGWRPLWVRSVTLGDMKRIVAEITSLRQQLAAAREDGELLDMLEDWFSGMRDIIIAHDEPDGHQHKRTWTASWGLRTVNVLLVEDYEDRCHKREWIRDALRAMRFDRARTEPDE